MNWFKKWIVIFLMSLGGFAFTQNREAVSEIKSQSTKLEKAINSNDANRQAEVYISLADTYYNQSNFSKSEENLLKAKAIYQKGNDKNGLAVVSRKLAQTQESQNKMGSAAENYKKAAGYSNVKKQETTNRNDYSRISSKSLKTKERAVQENISLNDKAANADELAKDYSNLAKINVQQNNVSKAAENLNNAYEIAKSSEPNQAIIINQKLTDLYVENKDFENAIQVKKKVLSEQFVKNNSQLKASEIQELANVYLKTDNVGEAIKLFKDAYQISLEKGHT